MSTSANGAPAADISAQGVKTTVTPKKEKPLSLLMRLWVPGTSTPIPADLSLAALRIALTAFCLGTLAGLALPRALPAIRATIAAAAARTDGLATTNAVWLRPQLQIYLLAWASFHLLEFVITARYNATRLYSDSFLISNGISYHLAHLFGITEFIIEDKLFPGCKSLAWWSAAGLVIVICGQITRSLAMVHAAGNFSHEVATRKRDDHQLVTDGIYRLFRHPSYAGFFYWALGTQIMLGNVVSTTVFAVVLWRFFANRISGEEAHLIYFFGQAYKDFRKRTPTRIPFIP